MNNLFHNNNIRPLLLLLTLLLLLLLLGNIGYRSQNSYDLPASVFDGERAYRDVVMQVSFGPRVPNSAAHDRTVEWVATQLRESAWEVEIQETSLLNQPVRNIIAHRGSRSSWLIIGAHYDSRLVADHDPDQNKRNQPVPGANDGASGVAVLLELARVLPKELNPGISLVFFDAEDNGNLPGWDWILGSQAYAASLTEFPEAVIIVDMIGDADLNIFKEKNSNPQLTAEIWAKASQLGYSEQFISQSKFAILDDHTPFLQLGIPAVDIIDFDYPYYHTTADTADKVSAQSLHAVGDTLFHWIISRQK